MATAAPPPRPPLLVLFDMADLVEKEILSRVDPADRAFFAQASHGCRAVLLASELPCAGTRVGMRPLTSPGRARLAGALRAATYGHTKGNVEHLKSLGYVASSDLPRAGGVVRLEFKEFCTSAGRLAWAKAKGCRWDAWTCTVAAQGGNLDALRWACNHGRPWNREMCRYAAENGHLAVLQWARSDGCPWAYFGGLWSYAAEGGHLEVLNWLRELGCQ